MSDIELLEQIMWGVWACAGSIIGLAIVVSYPSE